jgi:O-antigen/teichoic acid export membrane protein
MNRSPNKVEMLALASSWLLLDRVVRMGLGFAVSILIARYYGPTQWGMLSYLLASATLFAALATAGSEDIILRDLSQADSAQKIANIQKTTFILRLIFGSFAYLALVSLIGFTQGIGLVFYMSLVYGILFIFQASEIWEYRLRIEHRISVIASTHILTSVISSIVKLACVFFGWPLIYVTASMSAEYAGNMGILTNYRARHWSQWVGQFDRVYAKTLLKSSLLVMVSVTLVACQVRCEYYLVDYFLGIESVGIYAAAFKCMELFDILVVIFSMTLVPELAKRHVLEHPVLASRTYLLGFVFFLLMLIPIAFLYFLFPWLYGVKYLAAQDLIPWLAMRPLLVILGSIRSIFLVLEGRLRYVPLCAFVGLVCSLTAGWFLIPMLGLAGAAVSGFISLFVSNFVMDVFFQAQNITRMRGAFTQWGYLLEKGRQVLKLFKPNT